ncbi:ATP-binding response regulator [Xanthomonas graminis]|jgi:signal transduction histidine kinase|uniref:histidine kinase n=1 Tax=Xanthomonas graminis pv. graminis TaxID=134874 RepID=A0A1M4IN45_9XANT|nr:hybrid sensor histidine kinase/response regulator [Xanthomonas translucens]EKU24210.1 two-component system autoinducer [Xanthomonas translucens pv. graminis ART-Xtg29]OAX60158.1 hybrid sensor histidine kinase/response regulator [Xanthomonas translucens pv. graminis]UKE55040.1 response regulator [Xanthomonas translucens pv. graminis]WIH08294.1 response regulator [Xanthomonas translucens pv. graminis]WIH12767.1 response regulator [Xanthomonas translucens pv. graminis]
MPTTGTNLGPLRILMVEDSPEDAELLSDQLLDAGLEATFRRVEGESALRAALREFAPDIVLSDLSMPEFSGHQALRVLREHSSSVPFIFVSGTIGEETAVQALRDGANDYIIKHNPTRLPSAVVRAIREARTERERQRLESLALLAAGLSHDLRNILQPLLIVPELMIGRSDDPQLRHLAEVIAECGRRGHEMAESMLSFVRGSRTPSERVSLAGLFQAVQMLLKSSLPERVSLQVEVADPALSIEANYTELQQCLLNLGLNAIQAMPGGGALSISAATALGADGSEQVRILVRDTGVGMDAATQAQLFSPFFTTKPDGTGLGLISCKRIVESYGGSIGVDSTPGVGTCFELLIPLRGHAPSAEPEPAIPMGKGQRVLLVDGEATRLSLLGNALSSQGYRPQLASDGAAALRDVREHGMPDLLIVDSDIILLSAVSLLLALQDLDYRGPAIVLEDAGTAMQRDHFPRDIAVHVLRKPLEMQRVFRAVAHALESG